MKHADGNKLTTRFGYKIALINRDSLGYHDECIENQIVYISSERVGRGLRFKPLDFELDPRGHDAKSKHVFGRPNETAHKTQTDTNRHGKS